MAKAVNPIFELLSKTTVKDVLPSSGKDLITLKASQSLPSAVDILSKANVLSAPVFQDDADKGKDQKEAPLVSDCLGFVDSLDIIAFILEVSPEPARLSQDELKSLKFAGKVLSNTKLTEVIGVSRKDLLIKAFEGNPVSTFTSMFGFGIHRALLYNKDKRVVGTFSQSDVIRFVKTKLDQDKQKESALWSMASKNIMTLGYKSQPVFTVSHESSVLEALTFMVQKRLSAVAVVGKSGELIAEFTASQLRGLASSQFPDFVLTVEEYLKKYFPSQSGPPSVKSDVSLAEVLDKMVAKQSHRCFLVDSDSKPTFVLSLTDVLKMFANYTSE